MLEFHVNGPFVISLAKGRYGSFFEAGCPAFWKKHPKHANDKGIYIFARRAGRGHMPIYVGQSTSSFKKEAFHSDKIARHYAPALANKGKGTFVMFFVIPPKGRGRTNKTLFTEVETFLIQAGFAKNPELSNVKEAKRPGWAIDGVVQSKAKRPTGIESKFKKMMGLQRKQSQVCLISSSAS